MTKIKSCFLLLSLQIVIQITKIESKAQTGYFGAAAPDHSLHHHHFDSDHVVSSNPNVVPATTVQRIETFSNGCYKQTVKEADVTDNRRFVQTEEIICPPGVNTTSFLIEHHIMPPVQTTHLMTHHNGTQYYGIPQNATHFIVHNATYANGTFIPQHHNPNMGGLPFHPAMTTYPSDPSSLHSVNRQQKIEPSEHHSPEWAETPDTATSDILIISQKVGYYDKEKKSNAANDFRSVNCVAIFLPMIIFYSFM